MGAGSVNSISSEHHDQGGQPNGNQEHRPIHEASPLRVYLHRQTYALARFRLYDGSRSVMSNKQWQREVARIYRSTLRIMVTQQGARTSVEARCHCFDASVQSQLLVNLPPYSCPAGAYSHEIDRRRCSHASNIALHYRRPISRYACLVRMAACATRSLTCSFGHGGQSSQRQREVSIIWCPTRLTGL
jgi:hypothetical protein